MATRANVYLDGVPAWAELNWLGREVEIGGVRFRGALPTRRCVAINVNPETATRDANLPKAIMQHFGHADLGI
ncbi:MOSC domain-containing protein [Paraburkholderia sp. BL25I1N1]|uniref:MOSC domain-containing protein n=1 Tax=unclassified Paraburkholderia TaxID=2615204 RepID=UPI000D420C76|nr:MOSC domain-containing protein [Paraburkholderia sp. BL25I1N1]PRX84682.1 MOSC domain-containing protein [Paraburkholderia sp. BL25I1N1]